MFGSSFGGFVSQDAALRDQSSSERLIKNWRGFEKPDSEDSGVEEEFEVLDSESQEIPATPCSTSPEDLSLENAILANFPDGCDRSFTVELQDEDSYGIIPKNLTFAEIINILNQAVQEDNCEELDKVVQNIEDYEGRSITLDNENLKDFCSNQLNLELQNRSNHQHIYSNVLSQYKFDQEGFKYDYSVKELVLLAIAANDKLVEQYQDFLFAEENLSLLPLLVGNQKYIEAFIEKFHGTDGVYGRLKGQAIQLVEPNKIGFFSVIALRKEQKLLETVFVEYVLRDFGQVLKTSKPDPLYGVLETASLIKNEEFITIVLNAFERYINEPTKKASTEELLKKSFATLLETAISQERISVIEYLCKRYTNSADHAIYDVYEQAFADDKVITILKQQILKNIGARGRKEIYDLILKTASSADNIVFLGKVLNLVKGNTKLFRESFATISENASPTTVEQLQKYIDGIKDMTKFTEVPRGVEPGEEIQKALEKCLESRISHKYSEFEATKRGGIEASSGGRFAMRKGVEFFIKPLNVNNNYSVRSFITEVIAGPLYRLALFGKSPKIWLIEDDQDQVFLGSEFLPNFNAFNHLYIEARDKSNIKQEKYSDEAQHKFKEELQKSVENSKYFAKFLAACLIFREFDFNLGNFGIVETNDTGVTERKWAKIDHGLSFEYQRFDQECSSSDCLGILKFYLQERKQHGHPAVDGLLKEVLAELVDGGKLSEELGNMCKFLEESKALIEQLIDKQVGYLNKALSAHHCIKFSILNENFSYNAKRRVFVTDQGDELSKYFKEILYDQVKKAKEFSEELSKKNKDLKMEDLSLGCNSLDNTTGSHAQGDSSKAHSKVIVTESNGSDGENKKTVASSIRFQGHTSQDRKENLDITGQNALQLEQEEPSQQAKTDDLIQEKNQLGKEPNSAQKSLDGKIAELQDRKTFAKEEKNDTLNRMGGSIQNLISHNSREGKVLTNTEQQVKSSLGQEESENTRNQLEKLQKELNEKTQALESTKTQLAEKEEELKGVQVQLEQEKTKLQDELKKKEKELNSKTREVTKLTEEKSQLEKKRNSIQQDLVEKTKALNSTQAQLEKLQKDSDAKTKEFEGTKAQLERERDSVKQELDKTTEELKRKEADLKNGKKELDNVNEKVSKLEHETLNQQASIDDTNQALDTKTSEVTNLTEQLKNTKAQAGEEINKLNGQIDQLTAENTQLKDNLKTTTEKNTKLQSNFDAIKNTPKTTTEENTKLQNDLEVTRKIVNEKDSQIGNLNSNIIELNEQLRNKDSHIEGLNDQLKSNDVRVKELNNKLESKSKELNNTHGQLENKSKLENQIKELSCKNQKLSKASTHSKRQSNYASVSFVLSGVFAVGASLTMFHLVICISLAVAALTFLAVGFYCSYKANTALSNVEVKNGVDPIAVEV